MLFVVAIFLISFASIGCYYMLARYYKSRGVDGSLAISRARSIHQVVSQMDAQNDMDADMVGVEIAQAPSR